MPIEMTPSILEYSFIEDTELDVDTSRGYFTQGRYIEPLLRRVQSSAVVDDEVVIMAACYSRENRNRQ